MVTNAAQEPKRQTWERLELRCGSSEGDVAILDGKRYALRGSQSLIFLKALKEAEGAPLQAKALRPLLGEKPRPERIYRRLPLEIQAIIKPCGRGGPGWYFLSATMSTFDSPLVTLTEVDRLNNGYLY